MSKDSKPLVPVNPEGLDELAQSLLEVEAPVEQPAQALTPARNIQNPESYIILPSHRHEAYSYPDLLVAMGKTHHKKNWYQSHEALHKEGAYMLNLRQFADFLLLLKSGKAHDGKGKPVDVKRLNEILNDILEVKSPYRAEWLDADFKVDGSKFRINYNHRTVNGQLKPEISEPLQATALNEHGVQIDLATFNRQGMPTAIGKDFHYYRPDRDNNSVAWFGAISDRAVLGCGGYPQGSDSGLGVRPAKLYKK